MVSARLNSIMSKWVTKITDDSKPDPIIRGHKLSDLIKAFKWPEVQFLTLTGRLPNDRELQIFEAMLVACVDHGVGVASAQAARYVASTGNELNAALAAGILALGKLHGGAATPAALIFKEITEQDLSAQEFALKARQEKRRVPGFGHKVLKRGDGRVKTLIAKARELGFGGKYLDFALELEKELTAAVGKSLPLNIDGLLGALTLELGLAPELANAIFLLSRATGLIAHALEEQAEGPGVRRLGPDQYKYIGC